MGDAGWGTHWTARSITPLEARPATTGGRYDQGVGTTFKKTPRKSPTRETSTAAGCTPRNVGNGNDPNAPARLGNSGAISCGITVCNVENVNPLMDELREIVDGLETRTSADLWPLPSYRELLFIK